LTEPFKSPTFNHSVLITLDLVPMGLTQSQLAVPQRKPQVKPKLDLLLVLDGAALEILETRHQEDGVLLELHREILQ